MFDLNAVYVEWIAHPKAELMFPTCTVLPPQKMGGFSCYGAATLECTIVM